jgi:hypothetical protein
MQRTDAQDTGNTPKSSSQEVTKPGRITDWAAF